MMCQYSMSMQMTLKLLLKQLILQWNLKEFHKDVVIDLVGYRRMDITKWMNHQLLTQFLIRIFANMTLLNMYLVKISNEGIISEDEMHSFIEQVQKELRQAHDKIDKADKMDNPDMEKPAELALPLQSDEQSFTFDHLIILKYQ